MTIVASDIVRVTTKFTSPYSSQLQNVWHFIPTGAPSLSDALTVDAIEAWIDGWTTFLLPHLHEAVTFLEATIQVLSWVGTQWQVSYNAESATDVANFIPEAADAPLPASNSLMVQLITPQPNRRGRKFMWGFTEAANDVDGTPTSTVQAAVLNAIFHAVDLEVPFDSGGMAFNPIVLDPNQNDWEFITGEVIQNRWYVQRRRRAWIGV